MHNEYNIRRWRYVHYVCTYVRTYVCKNIHLVCIYNNQISLKSRKRFEEYEAEIVKMKVLSWSFCFLLQEVKYREKSYFYFQSHIEDCSQVLQDRSQRIEKLQKEVAELQVIQYTNTYV